jgi:hypothetical protein
MTREQERERLLDQAVYDGRISGGLRDHYSQCFDADPAGTRAFLARLGYAATQEQEPSKTATVPAGYPETLLSDTERTNLDAIRAGKRHSYIVNGG